MCSGVGTQTGLYDKKTGVKTSRYYPFTCTVSLKPRGTVPLHVSLNISWQVWQNDLSRWQAAYTCGIFKDGVRVLFKHRTGSLPSRCPGFEPLTNHHLWSHTPPWSISSLQWVKFFKAHFLYKAFIEENNLWKRVSWSNKYNLLIFWQFSLLYYKNKNQV